MTNARRISALLSLAGAFALNACSGGGSSTTPRAVNTAAPNQPTSLNFVFRIPPSSGAQAHRRRPTYVSPATTGVEIELLTNNGNAVDYIYGIYTLDVNVPGCAIVNGALQCQITITPPLSQPAVGNDVFSLKMMDANGRILSEANVPVTVAPTQSVPIPVTLNGRAQTITLTLANPTPAPGSTSTTNVMVTAFDADGYMIVGPGNYDYPITLHDSDTSGATSLSTTNVTTSGQTVTLSYTGDPKLEFATLTGTSSDPTTPLPTVTPTQLLPIPQAPFVWVTLLGSGSQSFAIGYPTAWLHHNEITVRPGPIIAAMVDFQFLDVDSAGNVYTADNTANVYKYNGTASTTTPVATINDNSSHIQNFAVGSTGNVFIYDNSATHGNLVEFTAPTYSSRLQSYLPTGSDAFNGLTSMRVGPADQVFAANTTAVNAFTAGVQTATVSLPGPDRISAIGLDAASDLFVGYNSETTPLTSPIKVYDPAVIAAGGQALGSITDSALTTNQSTSYSGIAVDAQGYVYALVNRTIVVYAPGTYSTTAPFGNVSVLPLTTAACCFNPADLSGSGNIPVPAGYTEPLVNTGGVNSIGVAH